MILPIETIILILVAALISWEIDREQPKPYPIGNGDTLMVRIVGYEFCPISCAVDHNHIGHFVDYDCEYTYCDHITINEN